MNTLFHSIHRLGLRHGRLVILLTALGCAVSAAIMVRGRFSSDISKMLPDGSFSARAYRVITGSGMFNKAMVLISAKREGVFQSSAFQRKLKALAEDLRQTHGVKNVLFETVPENAREEIAHLSAFFPESLPCPLEGRNGAEDVDALYKIILLSPVQPPATNDPAGLTRDFLKRLETFRGASPLKIRPGSRFLISKDGRHLLMTLSTAASIGSPGESAQLIRDLEECVRNHPLSPDAEIELAVPHRRAVENEKIVKRDIGIVSIATLVIFTLLTMLCYRGDPRSLFIPAIPVLASAIVLGSMKLLFGTTLLFMIGMGGIVVSLAVDYGIHIYAAMKTNFPMLNLRRILAPLWLGALTSGLAFLMFLLSPTEGVRQLGYFAGTSLILSLVLMLFLLPLVLSRRTMRDPLSPGVKTFPRKHPGTVLMIFLALGILFFFAIRNIRFNGDVRQFDASPPEIARLEQKIAGLFHTGDMPACLIFEAETPDAALEKTLAAQKIPGSFHPALLRPPESIRKQNLETWKKALRDGTLERYEKDALARAEKLGFETAAFTDFFRRLKQGIENPPPEPSPLVRSALEHLTARGNSGKTCYATVLIPEKESSLREAEEKCPEAVLISRTLLPERMARDAGGGILKILWFVGALVVLVTIIYFRSIAGFISALLPVAAAMLVTGGLFALCGKELNLASAVTGIILCGLSVDYGIFMTYALRNGHDHAITGAITLSAVTTAFGGMTVLFTRHPLLRDAGITLMCGILAAYLTALFMLPALYEWRTRILKKAGKTGKTGKAAQS